MARSKQTAMKRSGALSGNEKGSSQVSKASPNSAEHSSARKQRDKKQNEKNVKKSKGKLGKKLVYSLHEIRRCQNSLSNLIPRVRFQRVIRDITHHIAKECNVDGTYRWQSLALEALQEAAEMFMTCMFEDSNLCAIHAKRVTIYPKDIQLVLRLRNEFKDALRQVC